MQVQMKTCDNVYSIKKKKGDKPKGSMHTYAGKFLDHVCLCWGPERRRACTPGSFPPGYCACSHHTPHHSQIQLMQIVQHQNGTC